MKKGVDSPRINWESTQYKWASESRAQYLFIDENIDPAKSHGMPALTISELLRVKLSIYS